jgi:transcriptional regulator with XRE-family HTH domain
VETLGQRITRLRHEAGLSQSQLAVKSGIPSGTLKNWEQGHREPLASAVVLLARALGLSADVILGTYEEPAGAAPAPDKQPLAKATPQRAREVQAKKGKPGRKKP